MAMGQPNNLIRQIRRVVLGHHEGDGTDSELLKRFVAHRDEEAFAALVRRYGPLVLGVCRRVFQHRQDAEDAFQWSAENHVLIQVREWHARESRWSARQSLPDQCI